jgi:LPXTG-motif cell wall-anchored protein
MPPATLATTAPTTPSATLAATGSNEVLLLVGSLVLTVLGLALVLRRRIAIPRAE